MPNGAVHRLHVYLHTVHSKHICLQESLHDPRQQPPLTPWPPLRWALRPSLGLHLELHPVVADLWPASHLRPCGRLSSVSSSAPIPACSIKRIQRNVSTAKYGIRGQGAHLARFERSGMYRECCLPYVSTTHRGISDLVVQRSTCHYTYLGTSQCPESAHPSVAPSLWLQALTSLELKVWLPSAFK